MTDTATHDPQLYALLIGIDCYLPNVLPEGTYPCLGGCVRDVSHVQTFLGQRLNVPDERIFKLTSSNAGQTEPPEPRSQWPTYENIVAAFKALANQAQSGDAVYIHYSGHGGRARTIFPELKGPTGWDEGLVPMDVGLPTSRYVRDIEMASLLKLLSDKGLLVTLILDSCHSGGATRGTAVAARGMSPNGESNIDSTPRPSDSLVASHEQLVQTWQRLTAGATRDISLASGWLPDAKGYTLLAACRSIESAYEYAFDGKESNGALTYWLLDSLQQAGLGLTFKALQDRLIAKIHTQFQAQTPQLEGDADRMVFNVGSAQSYVAVNVTDLDQAARVKLNTGQAQGMDVGAQFAVYPNAVTDFSQVEQRIALVQISDVGASDSWADIKKTLGGASIHQGDHAVLINAGSADLLQKVGLVQADGTAVAVGIDPRLDAVRMAIAQNGQGFVAVANSGEPINYQVAINNAGEYEIRDPAGVPIANLRPALKASDPQAATTVAQRLVHLSRYQAIRNLENFDPLSPLARKLVVEVFKAPAGYQPGKRPNPQAFDTAGVPTIQTGDIIFLHIKNNSGYTLNITVLDLQPSWGIVKLYPPDASTSETYETGREDYLPLRPSLPDGYRQGSDILKVFATVGPADYSWLALPPLDQPASLSATRGAPADALESLMAALGGEQANQSVTRDLQLAATASRSWTTAQVEVQIQNPS